MNPVIHVQARGVIISNEHILLCKTKGLNVNFYFLPGGHINHGEGASNALIRELKEEIGIDFGIERFLGCVEYHFDPLVIQYAKCHTHEYNFIFQVRMQLDLDPKKQIMQIEDHILLEWIALIDLCQIDFRPAILKQQLLTWIDVDLHKALLSNIL